MNVALKLENYTYEDYLSIDKTTKERVELIDGQIYMMTGASALHQDIVLNLGYLLKNISKTQKRCFLRIAPYDLKLQRGKDISVVQPDVMIFCADEFPCAIFEVLSPSTAYKDKSIKKELYEANGITEYFLVNIEFQTIDKFILLDEKYIYDRVYGLEDAMPIVCMDSDIKVSEVFAEL